MNLNGTSVVDPFGTVPASFPVLRARWEADKQRKGGQNVTVAGYRPSPTLLFFLKVLVRVCLCGCTDGPASADDDFEEKEDDKAAAGPGNHRNCSILLAALMRDMFLVPLPHCIAHYRCSFS